MAQVPPQPVVLVGAGRSKQGGVPESISVNRGCSGYALQGYPGNRLGVGVGGRGAGHRKRILNMGGNQEVEAGETGPPRAPAVCVVQTTGLGIESPQSQARRELGIISFW